MVSGIDPLTDMPNRSAFFDKLDDLVRHAESPFCLMYVDIDGFKHLNDTMGHVKGDYLIQQLGHRISSAVINRQATVARIGGDEFAIIIDQLYDTTEIIETANYILHRVLEPIPMDGDHLEVTASIGIAIFPHDAYSVTDLVRYADMSLYEAKINGKNRYEFFNLQMSDNFQERRFIEQNLRYCLENEPETFHVYYQPKIDITEKRVVGMEALVRWYFNGEMIPPGKFIPVAEDSGMVDAIGQLVLRKACEFAKVLSGHGIDLKLAVNVAPQQFVHNSLERNVRDVLLETGISPANLELEITESSFMSNQHNAITVLRHLRKLGVTIAIDDFGTGWSSLAYLSEFPLDVLKIDKSFVDKVLSGNTKLVEAIISIAKSLDLEIVAEGVETEAQIDFMRQHNVRIVQGYYFARPMPADDFLEFVREFK